MNKLLVALGLAATVALVGCNKDKAPETGATTGEHLKMQLTKQAMILQMQLLKLATATADAVDNAATATAVATENAADATAQAAHDTKKLRKT